MAVGQRGRKPKGNYKQKTEVLSTRIRADTKAALAAAAKEHGHSLSQEIENRLRRSFDEDIGLFEKFGGRRNYAVLRMISGLMGTLSSPYLPDVSWLDNLRLYDQLVKMVGTVFAELRPPDDGSETPEDEAARNISGAGTVAQALIAIRDASPELPIGVTHLAPFIRADLGPVAERIGRQKGRRLVFGTSVDMLAAAKELEAEENERSDK
jgi:hypothetical protein